MSSGAFTKVWSTRACIVLCGVLSAVGLLGTSMATDIYTLMATLLLTGMNYLTVCYYRMLKFKGLNRWLVCFKRIYIFVKSI